MTDPTLHCPHCQGAIKLTESLAAPLLAASRQEFAQQLAAKDAQIAQEHAALHAREMALKTQQAHLEAQVQEKLQHERARLTAQITQREAERIKLEMASQLQSTQEANNQLQQLLSAQEEKLHAAQQAQADFLRQQRELQDARRELELTIEQRVQNTVGEVRARAQREAEEALNLKLLEREQTIASMQQKIAELKQKAEQGSQQMQGEVLELDLESRLREHFPFDTLQAVAKGELGADLRQQVFSPSGQRSGTLLWEIKRTKDWNKAWPAKLLADVHRDKADMGILVSQAMPKGIEHFALHEGVWVCSLPAALALASVLRQGVIQVQAARQFAQNQGSAQELVYEYLTGPRFKQRVEAIFNTFKVLQDDLKKERTAMTNLWAKREAQIHRLMSATAGMAGDVEGLAGKAVLQIEGFGTEGLLD